MGILTDPLDTLLSSRAKVRLLRLFTSVREPMSAREAARRIGMAKRSADLGLRDLVRVGVVQRLGAGPQPAYVINPDHALVRHAIEPLFRGSPTAGEDQDGGEPGFTTELFETLRDIVDAAGSPPVEWVGLFGSTARGEDDPDSDLDLAVIVATPDEVEAMQHHLTECGPIVQRRFGRPLSPVVLAREQLRVMARHRHALITAFREARVVTGMTRRLDDIIGGTDGSNTSGTAGKGPGVS